MKFSTIFFTRPINSLLFLVALSCIVSACENDKTEIARITVKNNSPTEEISGLETLYSDSGIVKVKVTASVLKKILLPKPITELPKGLLLEFYNDSLRVISKLSAHYAIHYEQEHRWEAMNDVVVVNQKGDQLNTEKMIWDERKQKIYSDQFVKIATKEEIIYGNGFESNQDFSSYRIFNVKGRITVKQ
jgi:LPS export ABC transporter protein LptC